MTRILSFSGDAARAARHLIANTSLAAGFEGQGSYAGNSSWRFLVRDDWNWSSGEEFCLMPILEAMSTHRLQFGLDSLYRVDARTRQVCLDAVAIYAGLHTLTVTVTGWARPTVTT